MGIDFIEQEKEDCQEGKNKVKRKSWKVERKAKKMLYSRAFIKKQAIEKGINRKAIQQKLFPLPLPLSTVAHGGVSFIHSPFK